MESSVTGGDAINAVIDSILVAAVAALSAAVFFASLVEAAVFYAILLAAELVLGPRAGGPVRVLVALEAGAFWAFFALGVFGVDAFAMQSVAQAAGVPVAAALQAAVLVPLLIPIKERIRHEGLMSGLLKASIVTVVHACMGLGLLGYAVLWYGAVPEVMFGFVAVVGSLEMCLLIASAHMYAVGAGGRAAVVQVAVTTVVWSVYFVLAALLPL